MDNAATTELIPLKQLAHQLQIDRSTMLKLVKRLRLNVVDYRSTDTGNQSAKAISKEDADFVINHRRSNGFGVDTFNKEYQQQNFLYIIDLDPQLCRIKVGTTNCAADRFASYTIINPFLKVLLLIEAPASCEGFLIALADKRGKRIGQELFEFERERLDKFVADFESAMKLLTN